MEQVQSEAVSDVVPVRNLFLVSYLKPFLAMSKPTVSLLVVVTLIPAMVMASEVGPSPLVVVAAVLGTFFASASAGIFNHVVEMESDKLMHRTRQRPLPIGRVTRLTAALAATILGLLSFVVLFFGAHPLAAWIALLANAFYVCVYTIFLKKRTVQNIVIGGAAGAVGPLIGWAAVSGTLSVDAWLQFFLIFMWTPPHFWALALKYKDDYARANIPMLPVVYGDQVTRKQIAVYAVLMVPVVIAIMWISQSSLPAWILNLGLTLSFAWMSLRLFLSGENKLAMPVFHLSCFYLFVIFSVLTVDQILLGKFL